jgi:hypothetical protein
MHFARLGHDAINGLSTDPQNQLGTSPTSGRSILSLLRPLAPKIAYATQNARKTMREVTSSLRGVQY